MRIAARLRNFFVSPWYMLFAPLRFFSRTVPRRAPIMILTVAAASGAAYAVGATQLSVGMNQRPDGASQHAATQPGISISASQSSASGTQHADMNISADTNIDAGASASQPDLTSTGASRSSGKSTTSVSINGQTIPVPDGGMVNRVMSDGSNTTTVQVSSNASDSANSSVDVQVQSTTSSGGGQ
jgi:hypothetical protein